MSFNKVLEELSLLTFEQRQLLILRAVELDSPSLSPEEEVIVEERLAGHHANPNSSLPIDEVKARLNTRFPK